MITLGELGRAYGIPLWDYERADCGGLLLTSGTGGMLAAMDSMPWIRYAWVLEGYREVTYDMAAFIEAANYLRTSFVVYAFFGIDRPRIVNELLSVTPDDRVVYFSNARLHCGTSTQSFAELVREAERCRLLV